MALLYKEEADNIHPAIPCDLPVDNHAEVQVDFREKATIIEQDEIQSAHCSHKQVAISLQWPGRTTGGPTPTVSCLITYSTTSTPHLCSTTGSSQVSKESCLEPPEAVDLASAGTLSTSSRSSTSRIQQLSFIFFFAASRGKGAVDSAVDTVKQQVFTSVKSCRHGCRVPCQMCKKGHKNQHILFVDGVDVEQHKTAAT